MTQYTNMNFSVDITRKDLKAMLANCHVDKWTDALVGYLLDNDTDPDTHGTFDEIGDAFRATNSAIEFYKFEAHGIPYYHIAACGIVEAWEADEDGCFVSGSDYDYDFNLTDEQVEELKNDLRIGG